MDTEEKLNKLLENLTEEELKEWVWSWRDMGDLFDIVKHWDEPVKEEAIKEVEEIMKKRGLCE